MKFLAAIRDPGTGQVFRGRDHHLAAQSAIRAGQEVASRVFREVLAQDSVNVGFVDEDGKFYDRASAKQSFGFHDSEQMWEKGMGMAS